MEGIKVFIVTDNNEGKKISKGFAELGTQVEEFSNLKRISKIDTEKYYVALLIVHLNDIDLHKSIQSLQKISDGSKILKFVFLRRDLMRQIDSESFNILHLEFLLRPVRLAEFFLLMEKAIMAERFKVMLRESSINLKEQGEGFEYLFEVFRKKLFEEKTSSGEVFDKILRLQEKMDAETDRMQRAVEKFSKIKQKNLYIEDHALVEDLLSPVLPMGDHKDREKMKVLENLQNFNVDLEEALVAAQAKIFDLQQEINQLKEK